MSKRPWILPSLVLLLACLAVLPACKKKQTEGGESTPATPPDGPPPAVSTDYLLFSHLNVKGVRDSALFGEVKQAVAKSGGTELLDKVEKESSETFGVKATEIDSVTVCVTEIPRQGDPKTIVILKADKPIDKSHAFGIKPQMNSDARGFYRSGATGLVHFPDEKTAVIVHPDLAQKYLDGYAKDRNAWPLNAELKKAFAGHTLFCSVDLTKLPREALRGPVAKQFGPLTSALSLTATLDLKGKEVSLGARAKFPDADTAGKAKETVQNFIKMALGFVDQFMQSKEMASLGAVKPAVEEAQRTLKDAKVDVSGSDLTLAATYKVDFDIGKVALDATKKVKEAAERTTAQNNLKQIGLALLNYGDTYGGVLPIHGTGAKGVPLKDAKEKPLLSWRVAILPYIEQGELYKQFKLDEPWDSENNKKLIEKMPKVFAPVAKPGKPGYTHLQMVIGPKALPTVNVGLAQFTDGTSNTIAVVEAAEPVIWTKPADVMLPGNELPKDLKKKFGGQFPGGFNVVMWDGSVRFVPDTISDRTLGFALCPNDGEVLGSDW